MLAHTPEYKSVCSKAGHMGRKERGAHRFLVGIQLSKQHYTIEREKRVFFKKKVEVIM